jgi:hypothetical protein
VKTLTAALLVVATFSWALPAAAGVETLHDPDADFSAYATYEWMESSVVAQIPEIRRYLVDRIDAQLESAGLKKVETGGDLKVGIRGATSGESSATSAYVGETTWTIGYVWRGARSFTETTLIVDVVDAAANHAIWHGMATKTFYSEDRMYYDRLRKKIDKVISKMFRDFPPKPGS